MIPGESGKVDAVVMKKRFFFGEKRTFSIRQNSAERGERKMKFINKGKWRAENSCCFKYLTFFAAG